VEIAGSNPARVTRVSTRNKLFYGQGDGSLSGVAVTRLGKKRYQQIEYGFSTLPRRAAAEKQESPLTLMAYIPSSDSRKARSELQPLR
jgi:hypothetical protein